MENEKNENNQCIYIDFKFLLNIRCDGIGLLRLLGNTVELRRPTYLNTCFHWLVSPLRRRFPTCLRKAEVNLRCNGLPIGWYTTLGRQPSVKSLLKVHVTRIYLCSVAAPILRIVYRWSVDWISPRRIGVLIEESWFRSAIQLRKQSASRSQVSRSERRTWDVIYTTRRDWELWGKNWFEWIDVDRKDWWKPKIPNPVCIKRTKNASVRVHWLGIFQVRVTALWHPIDSLAWQFGYCIKINILARWVAWTRGLTSCTLRIQSPPSRGFIDAYLFSPHPQGVM